MYIPGSTNPLIFAAGILFLGGAIYALVPGISEISPT